MASLWISQSKGCWVDLFDQVALAGRRLRVYGPAEFVDVRVAREDWGDEVRSLAIGPGAFLQCFQEINFNSTVLWFLPNAKVFDTRELQTEDLDSIRLFDRPPFQCEPGFDAYAWQYGANTERSVQKGEDLPSPIPKQTNFPAMRLVRATPRRRRANQGVPKVADSGQPLKLTVT